MAKGVMFL